MQVTSNHETTAPQAHRVAVRFDTRQFVRSHMTQPRGRGSWAFQVETVPALFWTPGEMTLTEAKAWLRQHVQALPNVPRNVLVEVMP